MPRYPVEIIYSEKYNDDDYKYRLIILPLDLYKRVEKIGRLLTETELKDLGIQISSGWNNYDIYKPEPHVLMMRKKQY